MKYYVIALFFLASLCLVNGAFADDFTVKPGDTVQKILGDWKGKRVKIRLADGTEITGKVCNVTSEVVELGEFPNQGYGNRIVAISEIAMLIVRPKEY
ncbi:MAG: hypothetical protein PHO83_04305 [Geobacteraceae bacterium]|nr:hypothetical protein [Geobacteraceae bacterium]